MHHALLESHEYARDGSKRWAAMQIGLMVSRQNGKGSILEAYELACLFLFGDRLVIHSAHQFDTSKEAFQRIEALISGTPEFKNEVARITWSHGEEGIELKTGQRLRFRTRTKGGGRGFTADKVILDEAMYLDSTMMAALLPTLSARPNPQVLLTGSAGDKDSTAFGLIRQHALAKSPGICYLEWSVDPCTEFCPSDCEDHDAIGIPSHAKGPEELKRAFIRLSHSYAKANPGLGIRQTVDFFEVERRAMDQEKFAQERLGVGDWPVEGDAWRVIPEEAWLNRETNLSAAQQPMALGIDTTPDLKYSCIAAAAANGETENGRPQVHYEITGDGIKLDYRVGTDWVVPRAIQIAKKRKVVFWIDPATQASRFIDPLTKAGVKVETLTMREYAQACGKVYSSIVPYKNNRPDAVHIGQTPLTTAVAGADKRDLSDMWAWDKKNAAVDISPLVAVTLARHGYDKMVNKPKPRPAFAFGD